MTDRPRPTGAPRRRVSRQRYWMRRLGVLVVLAAIGWAAVTGVVAVLGGGDDASDAAPTADASADTGTPDAAAPDTSVPASGDTTADPAVLDTTADAGESAVGVASAQGTDADAAAESADAGSDEPSDEPETDGPPTQANPATVYIVGDSDAGTFGPYLQTLLDGTLIVDTSLNYKVSSGLARPDFFNWPNELAARVPEVDPDIVVVTFGGNDAQGLSLPQDELEFLVGDPVANEADWSAEYERRVDEVLDILTGDDRSVVWVGIPNDDNPDVTARLRIQDQAVRAAIEGRDDVVFVDTWNRFSGRDGNWAEFVVDPRDGVGKDVRADDGFHLNVNGAEILAIDIAVEVRDLLRERGAAI